MHALARSHHNEGGAVVLDDFALYCGCSLFSRIYRISSGRTRPKSSFKCSYRVSSQSSRKALVLSHSAAEKTAMLCDCNIFIFFFFVSSSA
jgi:hypothetical protein